MPATMSKMSPYEAKKIMDFINECENDLLSKEGDKLISQVIKVIFCFLKDRARLEFTVADKQMSKKYKED